MNDHYLRFPDAATARSALRAVGLDTAERPFFIPDRVDVHVVGTVYDKTGADRNVVFTAQPGFHVNLRGVLPATLSQYEVFPATPRAVWA